MGSAQVREAKKAVRGAGEREEFKRVREQREDQGVTGA